MSGPDWYLAMRLSGMPDRKFECTGEKTALRKPGVLLLIADLLEYVRKQISCPSWFSGSAKREFVQDLTARNDT